MNYINQNLILKKCIVLRGKKLLFELCKDKLLSIEQFLIRLEKLEKYQTQKKCVENLYMS